VSISGNLRTMPFPDLLQWVSQSRKTGTLAVEGDPYSKKIYFREGTVIAASSENPKEYLGYYLVGWNYVGEDELQELLDMQDRHGTLLGELLVIIGRLSREELLHILQVKTEEAVYDLFLWESGDFRFLENILPAKKFQPLNLPVDMLIMEGVRRKDEWERSRQRIPDGNWIPRLVRAVDVQQMGPTELSILREINGENSIEDIALASRLALFHVLHFVDQGVSHGLFAINPPTGEDRPIPGFSQGSWRGRLREAEKALSNGDLLGAHRKLADLENTFAGNREVLENASAVSRRLREALDDLSLENSTILELAIPVSQLTSLSCSPEEGFMLSRINGIYSFGEILQMLPGSDVEHRLMVHALMQREVVRVKE
jgi:hypothetical protein